MTRSTAREIAMHCSFSLGFTLQAADELLEERLTQETFESWKNEDPIYEKFPDRPQMEYIRELVLGVGEHGPELDEYISRYAKNWQFARIPRTAAAIMRVSMYEILYMPTSPIGRLLTKRWRLRRNMRSPRWCPS